MEQNLAEDDLQALVRKIVYRDQPDQTYVTSTTTCRTLYEGLQLAST